MEKCDREPIHIPGAIQPHGVLLALDRDSLAVGKVGGDTADLIGLAPRALLGGGPETWLDAHHVARLRTLAAGMRSLERPFYAFDITFPRTGRHVEASVHRSGEFLVMELEAVSADEPHDAVATVQRSLQRLHAAPDMTGFCQAVVEEVRAFTGFDRVMVYRFLPDGSGAVVAAACAPGIDTFMGQHYPASDIPRQARALYLRSRIRVIPDAAYTPAPLVPADDPATGRALDLSQSVLRSVSPIHLEYLANMGVAASMSLALVLHGELWGLIACHHQTPRYLSRARRSTCELFVEMASFQLEATVTAQDLAARLHAKRVQEDLIAHIDYETDLSEGLTRRRPNLLDIVSAGGVALWFDGRVSTIGRTPRADEVADIVTWLDGSGEGVFATDRLPDLFPRARAFAEVASGLLALAVSKVPRDYVLWFRPEIIKTITWAGDPHKSVEVTGDGERLSPRRSFAAWKESVRQRAEPWRSDELEAARSLRLALLEVVLERIDQVARERAAARRRQELLMGELDHRVKNLLATIQALVSQSRSSAQTLDEFIERFDGRLRAMSRSHSLLTQSRWEGARLAVLVEEEMAPYVGGKEPAVVIGGSLPVLLRPKAALALSLALHELATNAAKYGALSAEGGQVRIDWRVNRQDGGPVLVLRWKEHGGPAVQVPTRHGFGLNLIEKSLSYELGGEVLTDFAPDGLACTIVVPWDQIASPADQLEPASPVVAASRKAVDLTGVRILVVEDNALIAAGLAEGLAAAGATVVGPAGRLAAAMGMIESAAIDVAVLDVDLDGTPVWPAADALAARGVPFVLATGHEAGLATPPRFVERPVVTKPFTIRNLSASLASELKLRRTTP